MRFTDRIFRKGERYSARGRVSSGEGSQYREPETSQPQTSQPQTSQSQTTVSAMVSEVRGAEALPEPPATITKTFKEAKYQSSSPPVQGADLEWEHPSLTDHHHP